MKYHLQHVCHSSNCIYNQVVSQVNFTKCTKYPVHSVSPPPKKKQQKSGKSRKRCSHVQKISKRSTDGNRFT